MKKVLLIVLTLGIGFWGCSDNTSLTGPEKTDVQTSFLKVTDYNSSALMKKADPNTAVINAAKGGKVKISLKSESVSAKGDLKFKKNNTFTINEAEVESELITVSLAGDGLAALDFEPDGLNLENPAILTVKFTGIDFDKDDKPDDYDFLYIDGDVLSPVPYQKIVIDKKGRWIKVVKAELTHFSRYGFTR